MFSEAMYVWTEFRESLPSHTCISFYIRLINIYRNVISRRLVYRTKIIICIVLINVKKNTTI